MKIESAWIVKLLAFPLTLLIFTPLALALSFFSLKFTFAPTTLAATPLPPVQIFGALPNEYPSVSVTPVVSDARVLLIKNYLIKYGSPLVPYAEKLVSEADKNKIDFRLLTAIAQQESNLCKYSPEDTFNCWGWGIHKAGTLGFQSYDEAIEVISLGIKEGYMDEGLITPEQMMTKYTPHSNGSWAHAVSTFIEDIQ